MFDKRVVRGNTHAAMVIPAGTYPDNLFSGGSPDKSGTQGGHGGTLKSVRKQLICNDNL